MLSDTRVLEASPGEVRGAVLAAGQAWEVAHYRAAAPSRVGAIRLARVTRVDAGLNGAFLDTGQGAAFLRARDAVPAGGRNARIARLTHEGALIPVQVTADAHGDKAATATAALRLAGDRLVYRPGRPGIVWPPGAAPDDSLVPELADDEGVEVQAGADRAALQQDLVALRDQWGAMATRIEGAGAPIELQPPPGPVARFLAAHAHDRLTRLVADPASARAARDWLRRMPTVTLETADEPFAELGIDTAIEAALASRVPLAGGGELVFEPGETLTAIDVNSGGRVGCAGRVALDLNLAAMPEIARQLRLRGLAGAIVVDLVRLDAPRDRTRVAQAMREVLADDPAACHVLGVSRLGLLELTRRRRGPALHELLREPVPEAPPRADAVAYAVLRDLVREARARPAGRYTVRVAAPVAQALQGPLAAAWDEANAAVGGGATLETHDGPRDRTGIAVG